VPNGLSHCEESELFPMNSCQTVSRIVKKSSFENCDERRLIVVARAISPSSKCVLSDQWSLKNPGQYIFNPERSWFTLELCKIPVFSHFSGIFQDHLYDFSRSLTISLSGSLAGWWHGITIFEGTMKHDRSLTQDSRGNCRRVFVSSHQFRNSCFESPLWNFRVHDSQLQQRTEVWLTKRFMAQSW
jgi:hypothetical protein